MDYRKLLWKYINHVGYEEGSTFMFSLDEDKFTEAEIVSLRLLDQIEYPASPTDMTDAELRAAWLRTDGEVGDPVADALLSEIERRNLDL